VVGATLRFLIEQVAEIEKAGVSAEAPLPADYILRKAAGSVVELAGIAAFHASPVWVLAALSDFAGAGRELTAEIAEALQTAGLLPAGRRFSTVNDVLDGLESTTAQMVQSLGTPPLNVAALREDWHKFCREAVKIPKAALPDPKQLWNQWNELKQEATAQGTTVLELSSVMAIAAIRGVPENARWLSKAVGVSSRRTGELVAHTLLDHYRDTLAEIRDAGYVKYWLREFQPYFKGAIRQFSTQRQSTTERLLKRVWPHKGTPN
jgi:hypothetical protein